MALIDSIKQMRQGGMSDTQIVQELKEQNFSPREINDALSRSNIKDAVGNGNKNNPSSFQQNQDNPYSQTREVGQGQMQASVMDQPNEQQSFQPPSPEEAEQPQQQNQGYQYPSTYPQVPQQPQQPQQKPSYPQPTQEYSDPYQQQQYYEPYQNYGQSYAGYGANTETINEIATQVVSENISKINSTLSSLKEFKTLMDSRVEKIDQRLQKIESVIDTLQASLIRKSMNQEENIHDIKSEMKMMQQGFSKALPRMLQHKTEKKKTTKRKSTKKK